MEFMVRIHVIIPESPEKRAKCKVHTVSVPISKVPMCDWIEFCPTLRDFLSLVSWLLLAALEDNGAFCGHSKHEMAVTSVIN
jgi:hypothetical protein